MFRHADVLPFATKSKLKTTPTYGTNARKAMWVGAKPVGPKNAYSLLAGACPDDCSVLARLGLSDELPKNSESSFSLATFE